MAMLTRPEADRTSTGRRQIDRPWSRICGDLSLSTESLALVEISEELITRINQLQNPFSPYPGRNKESESRLRALTAPKGPGGTPSLGQIGSKAGNPLLAQAIINNATREAPSDASSTGKKLQTKLDGEFTVGPLMAENALIISEEFGIDEVESYVLLRSMLWNKGVPISVDVELEGKDEGASKDVVTGDNTRPATDRYTTKKALSGPNTSFAQLDDIDFTIPRDILIAAFASYYNEEVLSLLRSVMCLCVASTNIEHPLHSVATQVIPLLLESDAASAPTTTHGANDYISYLLREYALRIGLDPEETDKSEKVLGKQSIVPRSRTLSEAGSIGKSYRSNDVSQILEEQFAILEAVFWLLWAGLLPWAQVAIPVIKLAYRCDLGKKIGSSRSSDFSSGTGTYLYLEDSDKVILKNVEMMWMVLCVSIFDLAHLLDGKVTLSSPPEDHPGDKMNYQRVYDPRLLPEMHSILSSSPSDPRYSPLLLSWAFVLYSISQAAVEVGEDLPNEYIAFMKVIIPEFTPHHVGAGIGSWMSSLLAGYSINELKVMEYLNASIVGHDPHAGGIFSGEFRGRKVGFGPPIYRTVIKRLSHCIPALISLPKLPSEHIATYLTLFATIFGYGPSLPELSSNYWSVDVFSPPRVAALDVTSAIFPLAGERYQLNGSLIPFIRVQRALSGVGSWDLEENAEQWSKDSEAFTRGLWGGSLYNNGAIVFLERNRGDARKEACRHVYHQLDQMDLYATVLPQKGLYETESTPNPNYDPSSPYSEPSITLYRNTQPFQLPGGSILPIRSIGREGSRKPLVINWEHRHSAWSLLLEVLQECIALVDNPNASRPNKNQTLGPFIQGAAGSHAINKRGAGKPVCFTLMSIGVDFDTIDIGNLILEILELFQSVLMHTDHVSHEALLNSMEQVDDVLSHSESMEDDDQGVQIDRAAPLELAPVIIQLLNDALSRPTQSSRAFDRGTKDVTKDRDKRIIARSISTLSALARASPRRVWPVMRSTGFLGLADGGFGFGVSSVTGAKSQPARSAMIAILVSERSTGSYAITISILSLIRALLDNAIQSDLDLSISREIQGEVLGNAIRFVHTNIWSEYSDWKYKRLGDRFEIGRRIAEIYTDILRNWSPEVSDGEKSSNGTVFRGLATYVLEVFVNQATPMTIVPLVHSLTVGQEMSAALKAAQRDKENAEVVWMIQSFLNLTRYLLSHKSYSLLCSRQCLLEHLLCVGTPQNIPSASGVRQQKKIPLDSIASLVASDDMGPNIPTYATEVLSLLILCFAKIEPSPPSLITHMTDAERTTRSFVRIIRDSRQDPRLRVAIWNLMSVAIDQQPAFAALFVTGSFYARSKLDQSRVEKGKGQVEEKATNGATDKVEAGGKSRTALSLAVQSASSWESLWDTDIEVLCAITRFITATWRHHLEYSSSIEPIRKDSAFWARLVWILRQPIAHSSDAEQEGSMEVDKPDKATLQEMNLTANRILVQSQVVELFAIEVAVFRGSARQGGAVTPTSPRPAAIRPLSIAALNTLIQTGDSMAQHLTKAIHCSLDITLHQRLAKKINDSMPNFLFEALRSPFSPIHRHFGTNYLYQIKLLEVRLYPEMVDAESKLRLRRVINDVYFLNCNWSIVDAQIQLTRAWKLFLQEGGALVQEKDAREDLLQISTSISQRIAAETRGAEIMIDVHSERLAVLLAILESTWSLPLVGNEKAAKSFTSLIRNVHAIIMSETFPLIGSLRRSMTGEGTSFHPTILRIAYFCARKSRQLCTSAHLPTAQQTAIISSAMLAITTSVAGALMEVVDNARVNQAQSIDRDMEQLVTVFEQCTRPEVHTSPRVWLERLQELNLARSSLELLAKCDLSGKLMDGDILRAYRYPLYARHMLAFQLCLSSMPPSAETLAMSGAVSAYSNLSIAPDLTVGTLEPFHPELPGDRNPGQSAWCTILSIMAGLVGSVGSSSTYFIETEVTSFVQFYGAQLSRALDWNIGQPLNTATLDELDAVMDLFYAMALAVNPRSSADAQATSILKTFAEKTLVLLQHLNYALSHPNHLASLFEASSSEERRILDRELAQSVAMASANDMLDTEKRPLIAGLTQKIHKIVRDITSTLSIVTQGDSIILGEPEDWPTVPHIALTTKVSVGELATMGTLLELGNGIIEIIEHSKDGKKSKISTFASVQAFDSSYDLSLLSQSLESVAIFAVSQLAIWTNQREQGDAPMDEGSADWNDVAYGKESGAAMNLLALKRGTFLPGVGGDVINELLGMLSKAKKALSKLRKGSGGETNIIDLIEVFLKSRIAH
ncbi:hypothetical protein FRC20_007885 [Serendipita sp. 405]|nr:hypothetical protein FRC20_007885 [Serendipita sp. 405]